MAREEQLPWRIGVLRHLNPAIICVLRSPVHGLASKRLLVLQYAGRKSGKSYTIPLAYVAHEGHTYCVTRNTLWWQSAVAAPSVKIWLRGVRSAARAKRVPSSDASARAVFTKFLTENPGTASLLYSVRIDARGIPNPSDVEREIDNSNIVRLTVGAQNILQ
jgi:deazaflavin-dependent oxidoreductase (nitroreductase family)